MLYVGAVVEVVAAGELSQLEGGDVGFQPIRVGALALVDNIARRVFGVEDELLTRAAAVGEGNLPAYEDKQEGRNPYHEGAGALHRGLHDVLEPVAERGRLGREAGCEAPPVARGAEYEVSVAPPLVRARAEGDGLVAGELYVLGALAHGQPDQRIEPAERGYADQRELGVGVTARYVYRLVREHQPELLVCVAPDGQQNDHFAPREPH